MTNSTVDLTQAADAIVLAEQVVASGFRTLKDSGGADVHQVLAYDLSHAASALATASSMLAYGARGTDEAKLAVAFTADAIAELGAKLVGREALWDIKADWAAPIASFLSTYRDPSFLASLAATQGPRHLDADFELVGETFHRFAEDQIRPHAEHVHRTNGDVPEELIAGLAELGGFGLSVPEEYDGFATGGESDYMGMCVATEELTWGSLAIGGAMITRPEIICRSLMAGGTVEQRQEWLPKLASTEVMAAIAVTEPDFGSDVAGVVTSATRTNGGWLITGTKTWCTFAARATVLLVLARTDPDRSKGHRGLTQFLVPKPVTDSHGFVLRQDAVSEGRTDPDGKIEGRPIDTIGYRGMHSYEVSFENWFLSDDLVIGGEEGVGRGFYSQMAGFENGRIQTAARAVGLMQAAYEAAYDYAENRKVFGSAIIDYELTKVKLGRMVAIIQACRQYSYEVAKLMAKGEGTLEASMAKAYVCKAAEWVTREAMQIHGGMGYAEEYAVSRYFVDARVLSIFEGADETLCIKVIARRMLEELA